MNSRAIRGAGRLFLVIGLTGEVITLIGLSFLGGWSAVGGFCMFLSGNFLSFIKTFVAINTS